MHLRKVNEVLEHKIVGGSEHQWTCWGEARFLDYETDHAHASVVFNTKTQEVYCAEVHDKLDEHKPYRWLNPSYKDSYIAEAKERNIDINVAWDENKWCDLETENDWLTKAGAIMSGLEFDSRVEVPLELENDTMFQLMVMAHERDITLNKMVETVLQEVIDKHTIDT